MRERPILFSGPMVRAILEGRKTQTRRVITRRNSTVDGYGWDARSWETLDFAAPCYPDGDAHRITPMGHGRYLKVPRKPCEDGSYFDDTRHRVRYRTEPGDRLWVREGIERGPDGDSVEYRADKALHPDANWPWKSDSLPSIFMPYGLSRLTLEVVGVRVERVQGTSQEDCIAEGWDPEWRREEFSDYARPILWYSALWDSINGKRPGCAWADNPWVWAVEFKVV